MCVYLGYLRVLNITVVMPIMCTQNRGAGSLNEGAFYFHLERFRFALPGCRLCFQ
jgi:hypothetical protein